MQTVIASSPPRLLQSNNSQVNHELAAIQAPPARKVRPCPHYRGARQDTINE
jgi:hypothetical protein